MQPLNRRKFVVLTGGALSISGCLDETDEGETDDSDVAIDDEESTGDQPEPTFESGAFPDEGGYYIETDDRFISYTEFPRDSGPVQFRFLEPPSEDSPAIVRVGVSKTRGADDGDEDVRRVQLPKNGPLPSYLPTEDWSDEERVRRALEPGVGSIDTRVSDEGDIALVPLESDYSKEDDCWVIEDPGSPEETVEYELPVVEEPGEYSVYQDYALVSPEQCFPRGIYGFEIPEDIDSYVPRLVLSVADEREGPDPESSRFYDSEIPGEVETDRFGTATLYHVLDENDLVYMEPQSETIDQGDGEITYRCRNYSHEVTNFSDAYWWRIYEYVDGEWEVKLVKEEGEGHPIPLYAGQYYDATLTLDDGTAYVEGEPATYPAERPELTPGIYAYIYSRDPGLGFAFEITE